jgi:hypothetical protein
VERGQGEDRDQNQGVSDLLAVQPLKLPAGDFPVEQQEFQGARGEIAGRVELEAKRRGGFPGARSAEREIPLPERLLDSLPGGAARGWIDLHRERKGPRMGLAIP